MKSDTVKKGFQRAPHRGLLRACGLKDGDFDKPFIGIANSFSQVVPGHCHLNEVARVVAEGVREAGGVPIEFNTIALCDGVAMGHTGMKYSLPSREIVADSVETMVRGHCFDGLCSAVRLKGGSSFPECDGDGQLGDPFPPSLQNVPHIPAPRL